MVHNEQISFQQSEFLSVKGFAKRLAVTLIRGLDEFGVHVRFNMNQCQSSLAHFFRGTRSVNAYPVTAGLLSRFQDFRWRIFQLIASVKVSRILATGTLGPLCEAIDLHIPLVPLR